MGHEARDCTLAGLQEVVERKYNVRLLTPKQPDETIKRAVGLCVSSTTKR